MNLDSDFWTLPLLGLVILVGGILAPLVVLAIVVLAIRDLFKPKAGPLSPPMSGRGIVDGR